MTPLEHALSLALRGFWVFPLQIGQKVPLHKGWQDEATRDPARIAKWFRKPYNVGIFTGKFQDDKALCVVDIDDKGVKHGSETLLALEFEGKDFPPTCEHTTPSGGRHLIYICDGPLRQGTDVLGSGLDIRSRGGLILGPGSEIDGKPYAQINGHSRLVPAPAWLVDHLGRDSDRAPVDRTPVVGVDPDRARLRSVEYLKTAPIALEGQGGDALTYRVAAQVKDFGVTQDQAVLLLDEHWNERCLPPWTLQELADKVAHAYQYGREQPGVAAPEAVFAAVAPAEVDEPKMLHPFAEISREYAFVKQGAYVLQETTDEDGAFITERLTVVEFNAWFANRPWARANEKPRPISMHWMEWSGRRQYDGVTFMPCRDMGPRWYNLWRGFAVQPAPGPANHPALDAFLEHALKNVCNNDPKLFTYLMGYFAHAVQRPWEKPLVALVMKGDKGTGKNACVERVGYLFGPHFLVADDERYLLGNFNSHLESNIMFVLDEASWAGDKRGEGKLKGLITGQKHLIEHKGKEPRTKKNLSRIVILGNADWVVPATQDERRFAVFHVGNGRKQDRQFFIDMREGMEQGGYAHLLRYLMDFDLSQVDINDAPNTKALTEQKLAGMPPIQEWWYDCLTSGAIAGGDFGGEWPAAIPTNRLRDAYYSWHRRRNIRTRPETEDAWGRIITKMAPSFKKVKVAKPALGNTTYDRCTPGLAKLRKDFEKFIQGDIEWAD